MPLPEGDGDQLSKEQTTPPGSSAQRAGSLLPPLPLQDGKWHCCRGAGVGRRWWNKGGWVLMLRWWGEKEATCSYMAS